MNYNYSFLVLLSLFYSISGDYAHDNNSIVMDFTTNLYPTTPMKKVQSLTMKLWGHVDAAFYHEQMRETFMVNQEQFAHQVIMLQSMLDFLLCSLEQQAYECPDCVTHALYDFEHLVQAFAQMKHHYQALIDYYQRYDAPCVVINYMLQFMYEKLKEVVENQRINTPLYAMLTVKRENFLVS
ncbi:MAG: hypothetical protein LVQ75_00190 [Candidatus Babeliales bacterium]